MIYVRDVAAVAARVLTTDGHERKAYTLTGPQAFRYSDLAALYSQVSSEKFGARK
jgi:NAD(P)H dehydrogenase (quinone)